MIMKNKIKVFSAFFIVWGGLVLAITNMYGLWGFSVLPFIEEEHVIKGVNPVPLEDPLSASASVYDTNPYPLEISA